MAMINQIQLKFALLTKLIS